VNSRVDPFRGRARGSANARGNPQRKPLRAFVATDTCAFLPFAQFCLSFCWERKSPWQEKPDKEVDPLRPLIVAIINRSGSARDYRVALGDMARRDRSAVGPRTFRPITVT
jgi:hypothetical protein